MVMCVNARAVARAMALPPGMELAWSVGWRVPQHCHVATMGLYSTFIAPLWQAARPCCCHMNVMVRHGRAMAFP